jgi:hypothetical protein
MNWISIPLAGVEVSTPALSVQPKESLMPDQVTAFDTSLSVPEIGRVFQDALGGRGVDFKPIDSGSNPLDAFKEQPTLEVVAHHDKWIGSWAVQLYVFDGEDRRRGTLHAVYHSVLTRLWGGFQNTYSKEASVNRLQQAFNALRAADPSLTTVGVA